MPHLITETQEYQGSNPKPYPVYLPIPKWLHLVNLQNSRCPVSLVPYCPTLVFCLSASIIPQPQFPIHPLSSNYRKLKVSQPQSAPKSQREKKTVVWSSSLANYPAEDLHLGGPGQGIYLQGEGIQNFRLRPCRNQDYCNFKDARVVWYVPDGLDIKFRM